MLLFSHSNNMISRNRLIVIMISLIGLFFISTIRDGHDWGGDFAQYIHHAKNIAEGNDYAEIGYVKNPFNPLDNPPSSYPPFFPLILSPFYEIAGINLFTMKIVVIVLFILSLYLIYLVFNKYLPEGYIIPLIAIIGLHPYFWQMKDNIMSDIPFMFLLFTSFYFIDKYIGHKSSNYLSLRNASLLGLIIYLPYSIRTVGLVLIASFLIYNLLKPKNLSKAYLLSLMVFTMLSVLQNAILSTDKSYWEYLINQPSNYLSNIITYLKLHADLLENGYSIGLRRISFLIFGGLAVLGYISRVRDRITILEVFYPTYIAVLIIWPFTAGMRSLIPIIPLFFFYSAYGLLNVNQRLDLKWKRVTHFIFISIILFAYIPQYAVEDYKPIGEGVELKETIELFEFVKQNSDKNSVILFRKPRVLALYTGRKSSYYYSENDTDLWRLIEHIKSSHIIVGPFDDEMLNKFAKENEEYLSLAFSNKDFQFFNILSYKNIIEN